MAKTFLNISGVIEQCGQMSDVYGAIAALAADRKGWQVDCPGDVPHVMEGQHEIPWNYARWAQSQAAEYKTWSVYIRTYVNLGLFCLDEMVDGHFGERLLERCRTRGISFDDASLPVHPHHMSMLGTMVEGNAKVIEQLRAWSSK